MSDWSIKRGVPPKGERSTIGTSKDIGTDVVVPLPRVRPEVAEFIEHHKTQGGTIHSVTNLNSVNTKFDFPKVYEQKSEILQETIAWAWLLDRYEITEDKKS